MADLSGFNANEVDPMTDFEPIPAGKYLALISESEFKKTKSGNGSYLELKFQIIEGEHKNRFLWTRLNLNNPNEETVEIALSELSSICRAVGIMKPKDSVELHNLPLVITVKCKRREDNGEMANEIKGYTKKEAAQGQPQQATTDNAPWRRRQ